MNARHSSRQYEVVTGKLKVERDSGIIFDLYCLITYDPLQKPANVFTACKLRMRQITWTLFYSRSKKNEPMFYHMMLTVDDSLEHPQNVWL